MNSLQLAQLEKLLRRANIFMTNDLDELEIAVTESNIPFVYVSLHKGTDLYSSMDLSIDDNDEIYQIILADIDDRHIEYKHYIKDLDIEDISIIVKRFYTVTESFNDRDVTNSELAITLNELNIVKVI